ncbi:hypothetical protein BDN71DRAFT_1594568 [Pleurotus eryngii]|uniref:Uncharacterized protein n=1 Tax=Pleurotus eryngii TaxID=5323 RepID=A0A9P5ZJ39_PLEER|nr:hypothetical protein BDN71DRAFT_1594568 [Pleurotus eryngii]
MSYYLNPFIQDGWGNDNPNTRTSGVRAPMVAVPPSNKPSAPVSLYFRRVDGRRLCYNVLDHQGQLRFVVSTDNPEEGFTIIRTTYGTPTVIASLEWGPTIPFVDFPHLRASRMPASQWLPLVEERYIA